MQSYEDIYRCVGRNILIVKLSDRIMEGVGRQHDLTFLTFVDCKMYKTAISTESAKMDMKENKEPYGSHSRKLL